MRHRTYYVAAIRGLMAERDLRYYDDRRIAYKSANLTAGEQMRDQLNRQPLLDQAGAEAFAQAITDYVLPKADTADLVRIFEGLRDCPRKVAR